jgi:hypothetical protein
LINASRVLSFIIKQALADGDTLSQLFRRLDIEWDIEFNSLYHYHQVQNRARFMIKYCRTMNDIRRELFTHRRKLVIDEINDDIVQAYSPLSNTHYTDYWPWPDVNTITSTPITDDEGYRTRLPTTASAGSSFIHFIGSPALSNHMELDWNSETDDGFY